MFCFCVTNDIDQRVGVFFSGKPFQLSLIIASKESAKVSSVTIYG